MTPAGRGEKRIEKKNNQTHIPKAKTVKYFFLTAVF